MRNNTKRLALALAIPVAIGGWALFRPELLWVNVQVNEKLPATAGQSSKKLSQGQFVSYAHETKGNAQIVEVGGKRFVRLTNFSTSNGPDVRVYLVKGSDAGNTGAGFIDLGSIKGNLGDQNYEIPMGTDLRAYGSVAIWCKRFSVGFGGAELKPEPKASASRSDLRGGSLTLASFEPSIRVTSGRFQSDEGKVRGSVELVEQDGKRFLRLKDVKTSAPVRVYLVKAETIKNSLTVRTSEKLDLGMLKSANQSFAVPKDIDAWLYRSVSLWDMKKNANLGDADLRSDQERPKTLA